MCAWIHDFQFVHFPDLYDTGTRRGIPEMVAAADRVVVSSKDALKDLFSFVPEAAPKARVLSFVADVEGKSSRFPTVSAGREASGASVSS
jgi:hypothetical protein